MEIRVLEKHGAPFPALNGSFVDTELRSSFLLDTQCDVPEILELINRAERGELGIESGGDSVWIAYFSNHIVITHQWVRDANGVESEIAISTQEARHLLASWQNARSEFYKQKGRPPGPP